MAAQWLCVLGIDLQEVVQHNEQHGYTAKEDSKAVEVGVCYHGGRLPAVEVMRELRCSREYCVIDERMRFYLELDGDLLEWKLAIAI